MRSRSLGVWFAILMLSVLPARGQTPDAASAQTARELSEQMRGIRQALDRMVELLETVSRRQEVDLMLKRIELHTRRLSPLESRLRSAENEVEGEENQIRDLRTMKQQQEELLDKEVREGADEPLSQTRRMLDDIERAIKSGEERLEAARMRVQQYENDLSRGRRETEILDEMLTELLESLGP